MSPDEQAVLLLANLPALKYELDQGAVIVIGRDRLGAEPSPAATPASTA